MKSDDVNNVAWALHIALENLFERWNLSEHEIRQLSGGSSSLELESRVAILQGIDMTCRRLFDLDEDRAYKWIKTPNKVFEGRSALEVLLEEDIEGMKRVLRYLEAELYA